MKAFIAFTTTLFLIAFSISGGVNALLTTDILMQNIAEVEEKEVEVVKYTKIVHVFPTIISVFNLNYPSKIDLQQQCFAEVITPPPEFSFLS